MICIKADIPKELNEIDDELKAIYHSKDTVCFYTFKTRDLRNEFVDKTKGMKKNMFCNTAIANTLIIYCKYEFTSEDEKVVNEDTFENDPDYSLAVDYGVNLKIFNK